MGKTKKKKKNQEAGTKKVIDPDTVSMAAAFLLIGTSLEDTGLIHRTPAGEWRETKGLKDMTTEDRDILELFNSLKILLSSHSSTSWKRYQSEALSSIKKLPDRNGNYILAGAHLALIASQRMIGPAAKMIESRAMRAVDNILPEVKKKAGFIVARDSYRIAENIDRASRGKPMLSNEIRDAVVKKWVPESALIDQCDPKNEDEE